MNTLIKYLKRCINLIPICHLSTENIFPIIQSETPLEVLLWGNLGVIVFSHESRSLCLSFSLLFFLYFFYLASLSASLLPRSSFYIDLYLAIFLYFFYLVLLSRSPVKKSLFSRFTIHESRPFYFPLLLPCLALPCLTRRL